MFFLLLGFFVMEKSRLINFIGKYHLGGLVNSVAWNSNGSLSTKFISDDKCVVGEVRLNNFNSQNAKFGVYQTDLLIKLLGVLGNTINLQINGADEKPFSLTFDDKSTTVNYMLADLAVIPPTPDLKQLPPFELTIPITKEFIDKFLKAKSALPEIEKFTVLKNKKEGKYQIVIGYSNTNSNRISIDVDCTSTEDTIEPISFSAKYFSGILAANKDLNGGTLKVSSEGLAVADFDIDDFDATYYLVKLEDN
jgi:hypothetical protein